MDFLIRIATFVKALFNLNSLKTDFLIRWSTFSRNETFCSKFPLLVWKKTTTKQYLCLCFMVLKEFEVSLSRRRWRELWVFHWCSSSAGCEALMNLNSLFCQMLSFPTIRRPACSESLLSGFLEIQPRGSRPNPFLWRLVKCNFDSELHPTMLIE